jgi:hypothetical protein
VCGVSGMHPASCSLSCGVNVVTGATCEAVWRLSQGKGKCKSLCSVMVYGVSGMYPVPINEAQHIFPSS